MAIKERKQITGTTAQIDAYEGHEGQIVWDKEKKTFVGMSGTAGKNYPLASQAYVDTQFLPLTGGQLKDGARISWLEGETYIGVNSEAGFRGIEISNSSNFSSGARLFLRDKSATEGREAGRAVLIASDGIKNSPLELYPDGDAYWCGNLVDTIVQQSTGFVRYASGLQIVWFKTPTVTNKGELQLWRLTYPLPFFGGKPISVFVTLRGNWGYSTTIQLENVGLTDCEGSLRRLDGEPTNNADIHILAIGWWK